MPKPIITIVLEDYNFDVILPEGMTEDALPVEIKYLHVSELPKYVDPETFLREVKV